MIMTDENIPPLTLQPSLHSSKANPIVVRNTSPKDFSGIIELTRAVYPGSPPWTERQLQSHLDLFHEGQFVAVNQDSGQIVGMAASLIVLWDDYDINTSWRDFTAGGTFENHDPASGRTLYGAEVMTHPDAQGTGVGSALYRARNDLVMRLDLLRIRAGARLRGYHRFADMLNADDYVERVVRGEVSDPTLSFQLHRGFRVLDVTSSYLRHDPDSRGNAAVIEWLNTAIAKPEDYLHGQERFRTAPTIIVPG
ncbi:MAG: GNAT family N-acetyltransferase [Gemmatimonas sp.]